jgi:hypothetical protein
MAVCGDTGANHTPVYNVADNHAECIDCELPITQWNIYIPERDDTVDLWLSETTIVEEPY